MHLMSKGLVIEAQGLSSRVSHIVEFLRSGARCRTSSRSEGDRHPRRPNFLKTSTQRTSPSKPKYETCLFEPQEWKTKTRSELLRRSFLRRLSRVTDALAGQHSRCFADRA